MSFLLKSMGLDYEDFRVTDGGNLNVSVIKIDQDNTFFNSFRLFPVTTQVENKYYFHLESLEETVVFITIYDQSGKVKQNTTLRVSKGKYLISFRTVLEDGIYMIKVDGPRIVHWCSFFIINKSREQS